MSHVLAPFPLRGTLHEPSAEGEKEASPQAGFDQRNQQSKKALKAALEQDASTEAAQALLQIPPTCISE
jgi:hypothetical protein